MKKQMFNLNKGIGSGIILLVLLILIVGIAGYFGFRRVNSVITVNKSIYLLQENIASLQLHTGSYQLAVYMKESEAKEREKKIILELLEKNQGVIEHIEKDLLQRNEASVQNAGAILPRFRSVFDQYDQSIQNNPQLEGSILGVLKELSAKIPEGMFWVEEMVLSSTILTGNTRLYFDKLNDENWKSIETSVGKLREDIKAWFEKVNNSNSLTGVHKDLSTLLGRFDEESQNYHEVVLTQQKMEDTMEALLVKFSSEFSQINTANTDIAAKAIKDSKSLIIIFLIITLITGFAIFLFLNRWIRGRMNRIIAGVRGESERVAAKADKLSFVSRNLAKGSSEQAASIEEMTSSVEEVSSMTRQNAENIRTTDTLMQEIREIVEKTNLALSDMNKSIEDISEASEATGKIVKVIDEIAFQTNLLALNAAIEAARAGEAGAGFSVVADEVRGLAAKSSEAAKNTFDLIERTLAKVKDGTESLSTTNQRFSEVSANSDKIAQLISEVSLASSEQAQGLQQVNSEIAGIDRVVQQNAADAHESADLTEELTSQSVKLKTYVDDLMGFIGIRDHQVYLFEDDEDEEVFIQSVQSAPSSRMLAAAASSPGTKRISM